MEDEGGIEENGKDGGDDEEDNKMHRNMKHGPESEPRVPAQGQSQSENGHDVQNLPNHDPRSLICKVTSRFSSIRLPEKRVEEEEVRGEIHAANGDDQVQVGAVEEAADDAGKSEQHTKDHKNLEKLPGLSKILTNYIELLA